MSKNVEILPPPPTLRGQILILLKESGSLFYIYYIILKRDPSLEWHLLKSNHLSYF